MPLSLMPKLKNQLTKIASALDTSRGIADSNYRKYQTSLTLIDRIYIIRAPKSGR